VKKLSIIALFVGVVGAANAISITNSVLSSNPAVSSTEIVSGTVVKRVLSNLTLNANLNEANVAWAFDFDSTGGSNPQASFTQVELTIRGTVTGGGLADILLATEQVRDISTTPSTLVGYGLMITSASEASWQRSIIVSFSKPVTLGQVQKDLYFHFTPAVTGGGQMTVDEIEQNFTPVPEPASMLGLALGGLLVARRRKSK